MFISAFFLILSGFLVFPVGIVLASPITEYSVIELVNRARQENGLGALATNEKLFEAAKDKAEDMIKNDYFAHTSPKGITPWDWFEKNNYDYKFAGENLAINFTRAEDQQKAWMESETHKKNILDPNYSEIGVSVQKGFINGKLTTIVVQEFGRQASYAESAGPGKTAGAKNSEVVLPSNALPKVDLETIKNFNQPIIETEKIFSDSMLGAAGSDPYYYWQIGVTALVWGIVAVINPIVLIWIIMRSVISFRKKYADLSVKLKLNKLSQEESQAILQKMMLDPKEGMYIKQMKLKRN